MTRIIAVHVPPVKPTRKSVRPARPFADGLYTRPRRFVPIEADLRFNAETSPLRDSLFDVEPDYDRMAEDAENVDRLCRGIVFA